MYTLFRITRQALYIASWLAYRMHQILYVPACVYHWLSSTLLHMHAWAAKRARHMLLPSIRCVLAEYSYWMIVRIRTRLQTYIVHIYAIPQCSFAMSHLFGSWHGSSCCRIWRNCCWLEVIVANHEVRRTVVWIIPQDICIDASLICYLGPLSRRPSQRTHSIANAGERHFR